MAHEFKTIYELLDALRVRPALYLGYTTIGHLSAFLSGLTFAKIDPGIPSVWGFNRWITGRVKGISTNLPCVWLEEKLGAEAALEAYFRYLDEYRACKEVEVAFASNAKLIPRFYLMDAEGNNQPPPLPDKLYVGQFAPSKVFFLGEVYGDDTERSFPYHRTMKSAIAEAKSRWSVPVSAWKRRRGAE
ncbi:MAG TPA: hypothetical protein VMS17_30030 [Gemmataceae bacterium]|nr:hypothetical protein [Gemmataceae bacterium]